MANINDYLKWRGDIKISERKPNILDSMVLSRFSYLPLWEIDLKENETVEEVCKKIKVLEDHTFIYNGDRDLSINLTKSPRFNNMIVSDYLNHYDKKIEKQFSAVVIHLNDNYMYVSFCGTDKTLIGWKEDFNLSYMENVPAQLDALKYMTNVANKYPNKKIITGGHSKGGNLAIYSSIMNTKDIQDRIIKIHNFDGPGFSKNILSQIKNKDIIDKITTYIPEESVIGRLLEHKEKCVIVKSDLKGLYQHDIFSWEVLATDVVKTSKVDKFSETINITVNKWLLSTTPNQRKIFVDNVFEIMQSTNAETYGEFYSKFVRKLPTMLKAYRGIDENDRKVIIKMIKEFAKAYFSVFMESRKEEKEVKRRIKKEKKNAA